jgi:Caspase domain
MKKALVIGIDHYQEQSPLKCCVNDANEVAALLQHNGDKEKTSNFEVELLTSDRSDLTSRGLVKAISRFFKSSNRADMAVLYFAGHGIINPQTDAGYLVSADGGPGAWGMSLWELLGLANEAHKSIGTSVIILDCCHAGHMGEVTGATEGGASVVGKGVTILSSCNDDEKAKEEGRHGVFTELLLDGLRGGCADIGGNITPASVYSHIDQALGAFDQRPLYKANVQRFVTLRKVKPRIEPEILRKLPIHFRDPTVMFPLNPSFEPDRDNVPERFRHIDKNDENAAVFQELQQYNRQGLVVPTQHDEHGVSAPINIKDMYSAAMHSTGCELTALGRAYHRLAERKKI